MSKKKDEVIEVSIPKVATRTITARLMGQSPLIFHAMSGKVRQELLLPSPKKNAAERKTTLKHNPLREFRGSLYLAQDGPTALYQPAVSFKKAMAAAALDIPGATKSQIGRLTWAVGDQVPIYGVPALFMSVVRNSDMARTPDVRTRGIVREWCCEITVEYLYPALKETSVVNLLAAAGIINGIGDFRQQKGSGNYGQFVIAGKAESKKWSEIVKAGGRKQQDKAIAAPDYYDHETEELYAWFLEEAKRRELEVVA